MSRGGDKGAGRAQTPYECEISIKFFKFQINFENLTLLVPLTFKKSTYWLCPWL
jgi:hypothetical protein